MLICLDESIVLRRITELDTDFVLSLLNNESIKNNFPRTKDITLKDHETFLNKLSNKNLYWIIEKDKIPVGTISLYDINYDHKRAEWGRLMILPKYRNQDIGKLALKEIINYSFLKLKLHKIYCYVMENNDIALKMYQDLGFKIKGILKDHYYINNKYIDYYLLELLN
jgi:UDP-4-amino-4,6-dideoxy-N-acetyl-beta-L-altrosamine N-acetyltransferase